MIQGWNDQEKGVEVQPTYGNQVKICYSGLLPKSGADQVFLHCGYSDPQNWREVQTLQMDRAMQGFEKSIPMRDHTAVFCFKDSAENWDNNNGHNWLIHS